MIGETDPLGHVRITWSSFGKPDTGHSAQSGAPRQALRKIPEWNLEGLERVSLGKQGRKGRERIT